MHNKRGVTAPKGTFSSYGSQYQSRNIIQKEKSFENQMQKVVLDQHYSNNILMTTLSTLQSLEAVYLKNKVKRENKAYGYYDKINFDDKNFLQLKSQLQTQLTLLKASRQIFERQNGSNKYQLPSTFNQQKVNSQIVHFKQVFANERQILQMCFDLQKINQGSFNSKMNFQSKNYSVKYPLEQEQAYKKNIVRNGIFAGREMDYQKEQMQRLNIRNPTNLFIHYYPKRR